MNKNVSASFTIIITHVRMLKLIWFIGHSGAEVQNAITQKT